MKFGFRSKGKKEYHYLLIVYILQNIREYWLGDLKLNVLFWISRF